ncbi:hypothetical protein HO621_03530 [Streptococcus suis]|uniref:Uncharacterized protein n=1 Tax=Streptococcus suis TaxID=1307 RepID=A0A0Z8CN06_STRSU|nr:hypothetical protein [Streptococcus suis]NQH92688.1 hypothetical protein [Streptococcus suis]NQI11882.1 hypothetical protein [Streptococcus suis]NQO72864.1 hypothetical protein [Streptococcus suis]CYU28071.1 Uncharacterised protein [Streptococcus suis]CYU66866.1 Uncharacterised protein [Streptococcus suis]
MLTINAKKICDAVFNDWKPEYDFEVEHFKLPLSKNDFFNTTYSTLGNITTNEYLKSLTGGSCYRYATFKRRAEILISHGKIRNLCFQKLDNTTIMNGLSQIDSDIPKSVTQFIKEDTTFDSIAWADYLISSGQVLGAMEADEIMLFSSLCYLRNIISLYGILPFLIELSHEDDCIYFHCVDFNNGLSKYFVSLTNPLASHFIEYAFNN